ncbi:MAG: D-alanyl-D-alanine carboxypeptidase family protein [Rhizobiaceae bacterium]
MQESSAQAFQIYQSRKQASHRLSFIIGICLAMFLIFHPVRTLAQEFPYLVVDRASGVVLSENKPFQRWYPASLTKLMTLYVALRAIKAGEIQPGSPVAMSKLATRQPPSKMGYVRGTRMRLDTAMKILIVKSANDVSVALAEAVSGTVGNFVARMNEEARRLGMNDSAFANPNGLHSPKQYVTARDMALLARTIFDEFPEYSDYFATPAIQTSKKVHYSYNLLLERFSGADGMKTGFVCASGYNMVASATRGERQLIAVVLGTFSQSERAIAAAKLLSEGFDSRTGPEISTYISSGASAPAENQRPRMCSEQARANRYDPGAGAAKIDSPFLETRKITRQPLTISVGGIDAPPSDAFASEQLAPKGKVPVPSPRPAYVRFDIDGERSEKLGRIRGLIPTPVWRPDLAR